MKKIILQLIILSAVVVATQGCKKYLAVDPPYSQDAENFFETPEDYDRALTGAYDLLQSSFLSLWIGEIA
ncbi:MAG: hypothetical protein RL679_894, partial [Bacteroidota bacterium]